MNLDMLTFNWVSEDERHNRLFSLSWGPSKLHRGGISEAPRSSPWFPSNSDNRPNCTYHFAFDAWFAASLRVAVP